MTRVHVVISFICHISVLEIFVPDSVSPLHGSVFLPNLAVCCKNLKRVQ